MSSVNIGFLNRVETELRKLAPDKGLRVWRGKSAGFLSPEENELDVVVLYLGSSAPGKPHPRLSAMAVGLDGGVMRIKADTLALTRVTPSGGSHDLWQNMLEVFSMLPSFSDD